MEREPIVIEIALLFDSHTKKKEVRPIETVDKVDEKSDLNVQATM